MAKPPQTASIPQPKHGCRSLAILDDGATCAALRADRKKYPQNVPPCGTAQCQQANGKLLGRFQLTEWRWVYPVVQDRDNLLRSACSVHSAHQAPWALISTENGALPPVVSLETGERVWPPCTPKPQFLLAGVCRVPETAERW